jgi:hypothetical protein
VILQPSELPTSTINDPILSKVVYKTTIYDLDKIYGKFKGIQFEKIQQESIYLYTDKEVAEIKIDFNDQDMDVWRIYLERAQISKNSEEIPHLFKTAFSLCQIPEQNDRVKSAEGIFNYFFKKKGDFYYERKEFEKSAKAFSMTSRRFEEIVVKFINKGDSDKDGLRIYLLKMLKRY